MILETVKVPAYTVDHHRMLVTAMPLIQFLIMNLTQLKWLITVQIKLPLVLEKQIDDVDVLAW